VLWSCPYKGGSRERPRSSTVVPTHMISSQLYYHLASEPPNASYLSQGPFHCLAWKSTNSRQSHAIESCSLFLHLRQPKIHNPIAICIYVQSHVSKSTGLQTSARYGQAAYDRNRFALFAPHDACVSKLELGDLAETSR
jgi:hypothetical protein